MKHSIVLKFIAVALCSAFLLSAVGSGVGALCLSEMGLYEQTVDELYEESRSSLAEAFANQIAIRYASQTLGNCPESMTDNYHIFNAGYYGYTLKDSAGQVLQEEKLEQTASNVRSYSFQVQKQYKKFLGYVSEEEEATPTYEDLNIIDNIPWDDVLVDEVFFYSNDGRDSSYGGEALGVLYHTTNGDVYFQSHDPNIRLHGDLIIQASFFSDGRLLYQITCSDGIGSFATDENGLLSVVFHNPDSAEATEPDYDDLYIIDNVHTSGMAVDEIYFYSEFHDWHYEGNHLGALHRGVNSVILQTTEPELQFLCDVPLITQVSCFYNGVLLYQISCPDGIGAFQIDDDGYMHIVFHPSEAPLVTEATEPPVTSEPVTENPTEAPTQYPLTVKAYNLINNIPDQGTIVDRVDYIAGNGLQSFTIGTQTGFLSYNADGAVIFQTTSPSPVKPDGDTFYYIAFYGTDGTLFYEASNPEGAGTFYLDEDNILHFTSTMKTAEPPTETTAPPAEETTPAEPSITDNIAKLGPKVSAISIIDSEGREYSIDPSVPLGKAFAYLFRNEDGTITCRSYDPMTLVAVPDTILCISFLDANGYLLYKVQSSESVGSFVFKGDTHMRFVTSVIPNPVVPVTEPYTEPITIPDTTTATEVVEIPVTIPQETVIAELTDPTEVPTEAAVARESSKDIFTSHYFDRELGKHVEGQFTYETMPEAYTVELSLAPGAYEMDAVYDLMQLVWRYRNELLYILGVSLLGFAVTAVYLCCAAGRKKGREEIRAGGFNCLSLDVYLGAGALAIWALAVLGIEGGYYLLRYSPQILAPFAVIMGYAAALTVVGFCFACAAQFKTPGGYWWRNTLIARCFQLTIRIFRWLERFLSTKFFPFLGRIIKACWHYTKRLWKYLCVFAVAGFRGLESALTWLGKGLGKIAQRTYAWLHAFLSLLPVTWQWLIIGGMLLFVLVMAVLTRSEGFVVLSVLAGIALVVYGAHCFGLLLESAKRMSKGDLEIKVDDKLMVGSFKEFAGDLNNLADVAVVAAQKQMASERMKAELITNVSHDIKTPLTSIINYVDLLQKPHTEEDEKAYLEVLSRQSQRMKKLLEDLIEMSKASTGNMAVNISRINAVETITQALGEFADKLEKAQLIPMLQQPDRPVYIQADGRLTWRVLSNLLSNAVKYALPGTRVYIDVTELEGKVLISMKNISRESLNVSAEELMERFVRGDASRNTEGSGLGLNIAQSLMEIQKGKLELTVDGDLFKVTLIFPGADA